MCGLMPVGSPSVTLTPDEMQSAASQVQLVAWELLNRVVAARLSGADVSEADVRLLVDLRADCMRHERLPR